MWIETALLYAWIRVCLQGAESLAAFVRGTEKLRRTQKARRPDGVGRTLSLPGGLPGPLPGSSREAGKRRRQSEREGSRSNSA